MAPLQVFNSRSDKHLTRQSGRQTLEVPSSPVLLQLYENATEW